MNEISQKQFWKLQELYENGTMAKKGLELHVEVVGENKTYKSGQRKAFCYLASYDVYLADPLVITAFKKYLKGL